MKIVLSGREVVLMGWDDPGRNDIPQPVRTMKRGRWEYVLTPREAKELKSDAEFYESAADGSTRTVARGLLKKLSRTMPPS